MWGMDREGFIIWIPSSRCLQASNIRSMAQFCLRIASYVLVILGFSKKQLMLFRGSLVSQSDLPKKLNKILDMAEEKSILGTCWHAIHRGQAR